MQKHIREYDELFIRISNRGGYCMGAVEEWAALYQNMIQDISNARDTDDRLSRIQYYKNNGNMDAFIASGIDVDGHLTWQHQERSRQIISDIRAHEGAERWATYFYHYRELENLRELGLLKEMQPIIDQELADLGLKAKEKVNYGSFMEDLAECPSATQRLEKLNLYREDGTLNRFKAEGYPVTNDLAALGLGLQSRIAPVIPTNAAEAAWIDRYNIITTDLENTGRWEERNSKYHSYKNELAAMKASGLPVDKDLAYLGLDSFGMRFVQDGTEALKDYAVGGGQDIRESAKEANLLRGMIKSNLVGTPMADEKGQLVPADGYTQEEVNAQAALSVRANATLRHNTLMPLGATVGVVVAPEITIPTLLAYQGYEGYQNTSGTVGYKLVGGLEAVTIGPLEQVYAQYESGELGQDFDVHPAKTAAHVLGAAGQPFMFMQGIRPLVKTGVTNLGKAGEIAKNAVKDIDIYGGLAPEAALPGGGTLKDIVFESAEATAADNYMLAGRKFSPELYAGKSTVEVVDLYAQKAMGNTTLSKQYGPSYTGKDSAILGQELERAGLNSPDKNYAAHHLIPVGENYANTELAELVENMHNKCAEAGFKLNSPANGVWLPGHNAEVSIYPETAPVHIGRNSEAYVKAIAKGVLDEKVVTADDIAEAVHEIRQKVLSGELEMNRAGPEQALNGLNLTRNAAFGLAAGQLNNAQNREGTGSIPVEESKVNMTAEQPAGRAEGMGAQPDFHEVFSFIRNQEEEKAKLQKERAQLQGKPLTQEEAEQKAISDYTNGESAILKAETKALDDELAGINANRERIGKLEENLGICKYLPDFVIRRIDRLKVGDVHYYEEETAKFDEQCKGYNKRNDAYNVKFLEMHKRLNTQEAREAIAEMAGQYMVDDKVRLTKLENIATKIEALEKVMTNNMHYAAGLFVKQESGTPERSAAAWRRITEIMEVKPRPDWPGAEKVRINPDREYRLQAKAIIEREGCWPGQAADREIAVRMYAMGYPRDNVTLGISHASPAAACMTASGQGRDYGCGITAQVEAMGHVPTLPGPGLHL